MGYASRRTARRETGEMTEAGRIDETALRTALAGGMRGPSGAFRRRAWNTFARALDRHLAGKANRASAKRR
jgi:hypothetical protein